MEMEFGQVVIHGRQAFCDFDRKPPQLLEVDMKSRQLGLRALAGTVVALGALAASVTPALAEPASPDASTSIFIAYSGTGYTGTPTDISGCGGHNMPYPVKSYQWLNRGQSGRMYNTANEQGAAATVLPADHAEQQSTPVGWKSIFIVC